MSKALGFDQFPLEYKIGFSKDVVKTERPLWGSGISSGFGFWDLIRPYSFLDPPGKQEVPQPALLCTNDVGDCHLQGKLGRYLGSEGFSSLGTGGIPVPGSRGGPWGQGLAPMTLEGFSNLHNSLIFGADGANK